MAVAAPVLVTVRITCHGSRARGAPGMRTIARSRRATPHPAVVTVKDTGADCPRTAPQAFPAVTAAICVTGVATHTFPTAPVRVNVRLVPGRTLNPLPVHTKRVPPATELSSGAANPGGCWVEATSTARETVSTSVRSVTVAPPVFETRIVYVTPEPVAGVTGVCATTAATASTGPTVKLVAGDVTVHAEPHASTATASAWLVTAVDAHGSPTTPVTVNVRLVPGVMFRDAADQT